MKTDVANLVLLKEELPVSVFFLSPDRPTTLGRAPENDIVLNDPGCSRFHAVMEKKGEEWILRDLDSRNGSALNDRLIEKETPVENGDRLQLAHSVLLFCSAATGSHSGDSPEEITTGGKTPRSLSETFAAAIGRMTDHQDLTHYLNQARDENRSLRHLLGQETEIIGNSPEIRSVLSLVKKVASSKATVLIRGESGVGKELVARAIHFSGPCKEKPLICLNCAALSESLLESELFGHEKGAFTGATERKIGKFEAADGGTLFLDEIAEMNPGLQAKFLRVLEGQPFERVGGNKPIKVDVRVIAATNRNLESEVTAGRFRHKLFFRLHVLEILVPPLRKRPADIPILANFFLEKFSRQTQQRFRGFSNAAMKRLTDYRWPGNVRELKNVIERAVLLGTPPAIVADDLLLSTLRAPGTVFHPMEPDESENDGDQTRKTGKETTSPQLTGKETSPPFVPQTLEEMERQLVEKTLAYFDWNKSKTARALGIERTTLDRKISRYGLTRS